MKNYRYLKRISFLMLLVTVVPMVLIFGYFVNRFTQQLNEGNDIFYEELLINFSDDFYNRINNMSDYVAELRVQSKKEDSPFYNGVEKFEEHEYYYYEPVKAMSEDYLFYDTDVYGIYYYGTERIIKQGGTQSPSRFFEINLEADAEGSSIDFFDREFYQENHWKVGTVVSSVNGSRSMLLGYCTKLGKNRDEAMIFFLMEPRQYKDSTALVYGGSDINWYICDEEGQNPYLSIINTEDTDYISYMKQSKKLPISFALSIAENSLQNNVVKYQKK